MFQSKCNHVVGNPENLFLGITLIFTKKSFSPILTYSNRIESKTKAVVIVFYYELFSRLAF